VQRKLIQPGKPTQNALIESFSGRFRDECLDEQWFISLVHARAEVTKWRHGDNQGRPHSALELPCAIGVCCEAAPEFFRSDHPSGGH